MPRITSTFKQVEAEKKVIDGFFAEGYEISEVTENLEGAFVTFARRNDNDELETKELHVVTADGRIHFSNKILELQRAL